ncbi:unnamed protein product [Blepharisma stoltei]|uniref:PPM-type phosphatase domain-containing protein n=1 Tax=Blepharisma stoltei TaxID=1481888 RepID=A0AAU9K5Q5_9CILI|nr:unnamed protein product [Blepharisma stoltei]
MGTCITKEKVNPEILKLDFIMNDSSRMLSKAYSDKKVKSLRTREESQNTERLTSASQEDEKNSFSMSCPRVVIEGVMSSRLQKEFEDKKITVNTDISQENYLQKLGIGVACKKGFKPRMPNQDEFSIIVDKRFIYLGVFDGHGEDGHQISNYVHKFLPKLLIDHPKFDYDALFAFFECYPEINDRLHKIGLQKNNEFDSVLSGTTATSLLMRNDHLYVGHVGDTRAVLGSKFDNGIKAIRITTDHKPWLVEERKRIESCKGEVKKLPHEILYRIYAKGKHFPGLATSRTLGDGLAQSLGVSPKPQLIDLELKICDEVLLLCSDGVWEFIEDQEAVDLVAGYEDNPKEGAEALAELAKDRWLSHEGYGVDDITVVLGFISKMRQMEE